MKIHSELVKKYRADRQWSQEQLSELCGLNLRTIQRLESSGKASMESVRALAAVFEVEATTFIADASEATPSTWDNLKTSLMKYDNFSGRTGRREYWQFLLFYILLVAIGSVIDLKLETLVALILLLPLLAVGSRRLHDAGESPWWQLLFLVPFGFVPVFFLLAKESKTDVAADGAQSSSTA